MPTTSGAGAECKQQEAVPERFKNVEHRGGASMEEEHGVGTREIDTNCGGIEPASPAVDGIEEADEAGAELMAGDDEEVARWRKEQWRKLKLSNAGHHK